MWNHFQGEDISHPTKEATEQRNAVLRYLVFYSTGTTKTTHSVKDVVMTMASLLYKDNSKTTSDLLWDEDDFGDENALFNLAGDSPVTENAAAITEEAEKIETVLQIEQDKILEPKEHLVLEFPSNDAAPTQAPVPNAVVKEVTIEDATDRLLLSVSKFLHEYGTDSQKNFMKACSAILARSPVTSASNKAALALYKLLNMTALTMLRRMSKSTPQVISGLLKENYRNNINNLIRGDLPRSFAPPSDEVLLALGGHIVKTDPELRCLFAKIVRTWVSSRLSNPNAHAIIEASLLTHTAWNGMGILYYLFEICQHYKVSWKRILHLSSVTHTVTSWTAITTIFQTHMLKTQVDSTIPWARIIDDAYFSKFASAQHYVLASIFAEPLMKAQGDRGLESAQWATKYEDARINMAA